MEPSRYAACIRACNDCADACDHCAAACLAEEDPGAMARCIALDMDCAAICRLAAGFMARESENAEALCALCSEICEACFGECATHDMDHCKACAEACRRCADECARMAPTGFGAKGTTSAGAHRH